MTCRHGLTVTNALLLVTLAGRDAPECLERSRLPAYYQDMDETGDKTPPGWLVKSLERSEAQIAAGQVVPLDPVLDRLRASIARIKAARIPAEAKSARKAR